MQTREAYSVSLSSRARKETRNLDRQTMARVAKAIDSLADNPRRQGLTVFMLGRRCANDFSEILLLTSNGYGFAALQILRSMFEKLVDARYLHEYPKEVDNFWDYHLVLLAKLGYQDVALKFDAEWEKKVAKFKTAGKKGGRTQPRWTKLTLVDEAKQVGLGDHLHGAYNLPNAFIHISSAELLFALEADTNGRFTPLGVCRFIKLSN